jgi:hypothetical protein
MANDHAPRMSTREYFSYLDQGAEATTAADVQHLRTDLMHRWPGDPRAEDLTETLFMHQEQLAARENTLRVEAGRILSEHADNTGGPTA